MLTLFDSLGLSWLIGESSSELLSSSIFLFVKHPYDVGDMVRLSHVNVQTQPEY